MSRVCYIKRSSDRNRVATFCVIFFILFRNCVLYFCELFRWNYFRIVCQKIGYCCSFDTIILCIVTWCARLKRTARRETSFTRSHRPNNKVTEDGYPFQIFTPFSHRHVKLMRLETPLLVGGQLRRHKYCREPCWPHGTDTALNNMRACVRGLRVPESFVVENCDQGFPLAKYRPCFINFFYSAKRLIFDVNKLKNKKEKYDRSNHEISVLVEKYTFFNRFICIRELIFNELYETVITSAVRKIINAWNIFSAVLHRDKAICQPVFWENLDCIPSRLATPYSRITRISSERERMVTVFVQAFR